MKMRNAARKRSNQVTANRKPIRWTEKRLLDLITGGVQEDLHLEYKSGAVLGLSRQRLTEAEKQEICKDVSALANSDGGTILYGVDEKDHVPNGLSPIDRTMGKHEMLEQIINSGISRRIPGLDIKPVSLSGGNKGKVVYAVTVPRSDFAPHQAKDGRYYKRHNFQVLWMEDYEVRDVAGRRSIDPAPVTIDTVDLDLVAYIVIKNASTRPVFNVRFDVDLSITTGWGSSFGEFTIFKDGIKVFPAAKEYAIQYGVMHMLLGEPPPERPNHIPAFRIGVTYDRFGAQDRFHDEFEIDFREYNHTAASPGRIMPQLERLNKHLKEQGKTLEELTKLVKQFGERATSSTGLDLSIRTLQLVTALSDGVPKFNLGQAEVADLMLLAEMNLNDAAKVYHETRWGGVETWAALQEKLSLPQKTLTLLQRWFRLAEEADAGIAQAEK